MNPLPLASVILVCSIVSGTWLGYRDATVAQVSVRQPVAVSTPIAVAGKPANTALATWQDQVSSLPKTPLHHDMLRIARINEAARKLSRQELESLLEAGLANEMDESSNYPIYTLVQELLSRDPRSAAEILLKHNALSRFGPVFAAWGEQDAAAALAWLDAHPKVNGRIDVLIGMAKTAPAEAFDQLKNDPHRDQLDQGYTLFTEWAKQDPTAAVKAWSENQDWLAHSIMNWGITISGCTPAQRETLLAEFQKLTDLNLRAKGLAGIASYHILSKNPEAALKLVNETHLPTKHQQELRDSVLQCWRQRDSGRAADWYWQTTPPDQRVEGMENLLRMLNLPGIAVGENSYTWLKKQPPESLPAETPQLYLQSTFAAAPAKALTEWRELTATIPTTMAISKLGRYLATTPQGARIPALLQEAKFPTQLASQILQAAGLGGTF
jgi:hypothetical protein